MTETTYKGLPPAPHLRAVEPTELAEERAHHCLVGLWRALTERHGTDWLDEVLLDARLHAAAEALDQERGEPRRLVAADLAERLLRGCRERRSGKMEASPRARPKDEAGVLAPGVRGRAAAGVNGAVHRG